MPSIKLKRCRTCNKTENKVKFIYGNKRCTKCLYQERKQYFKDYYNTHYERLKKYRKEYYIKHREKLNKYHNEYYHTKTKIINKKNKKNKKIKKTKKIDIPLDLTITFDMLY